MSSGIEEIIEEIEEYVDGCKPSAFSPSKIIVNRDELESLLEELRTKTPEEIKNLTVACDIASRAFEKIIKDFQNIDWEKVDKETAKKLIKSISFIFDITKKSNPISYAVFYSMQYIFWQVVVVGGILCKMKLSAKLLSNALSLFEKEPNNLFIEDNDIIELITENEMFKDKMKQLIQKYGEGKNEFIVDDSAPAEDISITFDSKDLLFALHNATVFVKAQKNEDDIWEMEVQIKDTYDFTDFKNLKEYADNKDGILEDILSTTLNNLAVVSSEYGVIKIYDLEIRFRTKEGKY